MGLDVRVVDGLARSGEYVGEAEMALEQRVSVLGTIGAVERRIGVELLQLLIEVDALGTGSLARGCRRQSDSEGAGIERHHKARGTVLAALLVDLQRYD